MLKFTWLAVIFVALTVSCHAACTKPKVKSSTYSTENHHFSSESVFIAQVEVDCGGEVSWTEDHAKAKSGMRVVKFYDDEGASSVRKSLRYGEEIPTSPLFSVDIKYKSTKADLWLSPAFLAMIVGLLVFWLAYMAKCKLHE